VAGAARVGAVSERRRDESPTAPERCSKRPNSAILSVGSPLPPKFFRAYGLATAAATAGVAITRLAWPIFAPTPFAPLFGAVAAATHWGSPGAGLLAIALSVAGSYLAFPASGVYHWRLQTAIGFVLVSVVGNRLIAGRNRATAALREREAQLRATLDDVRTSGEKLRRAQEIEAVGRLAAGLAHNFNNLLTVTMGYIDALVENPADAQLQREALPEMRKATERGAALTRQLLAFGHAHEPQRTLVQVDRAIEAMRDMLRRVVREDVRLTFDFGWEPAGVLMDPHDLEQVVLNLVMNARDALTGGGTIHVTVGREIVRAGDTRTGASPGECVVLCVRDNGIGMAPDVRARLFEPFFTTKAEGQGTGLGLTFVDEIARQAGGFVSVTTAPGEGTSVFVYLSAAPAETQAAVATLTAMTATSSTPGTILLVEDEDSVREVTAWILRRGGHRVLPAASAAEAIALFGMYPRGIDLLVTDIVMPQMHGAALAKELLAKRPQLPVLFVSAYPDARPPRDNADRRMGFLAKPYSATMLLAAVAELKAPPAHAVHALQ
jgi:two-component system cell cycle sensor histidine kinase/response regulator CckA